MIQIGGLPQFRKVCKWILHSHWCFSYLLEVKEAAFYIPQLNLSIGPWGELLSSWLGWYNYLLIFQLLYLCWFLFTRIAKLFYILPRIPFFMSEASMWSLIAILSDNNFILIHSIFVSISRFIHQALNRAYSQYPSGQVGCAFLLLQLEGGCWCK